MTEEITLLKNESKTVTLALKIRFVLDKFRPQIINTPTPILEMKMTKLKLWFMQ